MICIKVLLFCVIFDCIHGQLLEKESAFDINSYLGNLVPNFGIGRNPQANYPGTSQHPINGAQLNNPQGNIWNNGNGNPGMNYPANSMYYPGNAIEGNYPQTSIPRQGWNPQMQSGYPNPTPQGNYPQTSPGQGWKSPQTQSGYLNHQLPLVSRPGQLLNAGTNWNGVGANVNANYPNAIAYPQNGFQTGVAYSGQENNAKNPNIYQPGNVYPSENDNIQKLNPNYPTANNWNNGLNPRVNYPGNPQPYPVNGIQTDQPNSWNAGNQYQTPNQYGYQNPSQLGYQNGQVNQNPSQTGYPSQGDSYTGFRNEASQYPNHSEQADVAVTTEKAAILGNPVIFSEIKPSTPKSEEVDKEAQTKCVQDCSTSSVYQPICGDNNVTYFNEEKFECAQKCGIEVAIEKRGACDEQ